VESARAEAGRGKSSWLNPAVAITVALLATFMGICKVKDDNIVLAMRQAQVNKLESANREQIAIYQALAKDQATYDVLNLRDDQFGLLDALIAIAISLLAVASLTQLPWLYAMAWVPSGFGVLMGLSGLSGLIGWSIHPTRRIQLLN